MATVNNRSVVDDLIAADGRYEDDPRVVRIVEYTNAWGGKCWGLVYEIDPLDKYDESGSVREPRIIWEAQA